ncbi:MAG: hypothetical protein ACWGO1_11310 [Anaerolineales bacterium]
MHYISILSTIISFVFAFAVFNRYRQRKGTHLLLWGFGLVLYGLGTLTEVILGFTFSELALKVWYLSGAMLTAAWLGQGTVHLLVRRRGVASTLTVVLAIVSLLAAVLVLTAPLTPAVNSFNPNLPISSQYQEFMTRSGLIILLTILLNIYGTITLVGGAIYSAYLFWRKKVLLNRVVGNILIAAGAMMPAMGGAFIRAGMADWLYISEFLGVILMYIGFMQATAKPAAESTPAVTAS